MPTNLPEFIKNNFKPSVVKQPEDERDFVFKSPTPIPELKLPKKYINSHIREIENQLQTGSCVANATCSALEMSYTKAEVNLSRLFVYYNAREPFPNLKERDRGAYVREGFRSIKNLGVPDEKDWPFIVERVNTKPSPEAYKAAKPGVRTIKEYSRLRYISDVKQAVLNNQPVVFGMMLKEDFFYIQGPLATQNYTAQGRNVGGHAMSIVGYDDDLQGFIVENSWSENWGDHGLWLLKYSIFSQYVFDIWTATGFQTEFDKEKKDKEKKWTPSYILRKLKKCCSKLFHKKGKKERVSH